MRRNRKRNKNLLGITLGILGAVIVTLVVILFVINSFISKDNNQFDNTNIGNTEANNNTGDDIETSSEYMILPDKNGIPVAQIDIDLNELKQKNQDVCAFIYIPDTGINCPIVCNDADANYYSNNDIENIKGSFIQNYNHKDFSDRMTVVYGKKQNEKSQFEGIFKYKDKNFYDEHKYIYVCTGEKILTYKVFAAHKAYAEHLVLGYDFTQDGIFLEYLSGVLKGSDGVDSSANIDSDTVIKATDKILTLSERMEGEDDYRYLVQGVLVSETQKEE